MKRSLFVLMLLGLIVATGINSGAKTKPFVARHGISPLLSADFYLTQVPINDQVSAPMTLSYDFAAGMLLPAPPPCISGFTGMVEDNPDGSATAYCISNYGPQSYFNGSKACAYCTWEPP